MNQPNRFLICRKFFGVTASAGAYRNAESTKRVTVTGPYRIDRNRTVLGLLGGYELARYAGGCAFVAWMCDWRGVEYIARGGGWISCLHVAVVPRHCTQQYVFLLARSRDLSLAVSFVRTGGG